LRALRDERAAALQPVDPDLARVAWRELGALVDKLAAGEPYRLTREELPPGHPLRRQGRSGELLVLDGDDELRAMLDIPASRLRVSQLNASPQLRPLDLKSGKRKHPRAGGGVSLLRRQHRRVQGSTM
jgi:uncharacterized protein with von Willebrand factor type A (vWA) domain